MAKAAAKAKLVLCKTRPPRSDVNSVKLAPPGKSQQRPAVWIGAALFVLALMAGGPARAQDEDPLDKRSTEWRAAEWWALDEAEQDRFLVGFSLGWSGVVEDGAAGLSPDETWALFAARLQLAEISQRPPGPRVAVVLTAVQASDPLPAFAVSGADWLALESRHRMALLHGVYAATYARALDGHLGDQATAEEFDEAFAEARRRVQPKLALAPSLLFARLSDWLFYTNHRPAPLMEIIATIAEQIKGP